ncbi:hypothetical protein NEDG_00341 [Nematocida displodere]|uniref:C3H1-type domain-containing protein n=1 Tax=Nematocida displodere TaxID=1805483 RepID=A0A177EJJ7_9MICR|nr:hypothetical protein NEDG_00341 [Nematocida displodere]
MTKKGTKAKEPMKAKDAKKLVEEQMFGMKNKGKSSKLKKLASTLEASYTKGKGKKAEEAQEEVYEVYEILQKAPTGVDPMGVLCINFKNGVCSKGEQCKFSHEANAEKRQMLLLQKTAATAQQEGRDAKDKDAKDKDPKEEKICKFYIDALKTGKHNPKWVCPNGHACLGKHSPPEGYTLKEDEGPGITIEEYIENERNKLPDVQTPMTEELFFKWKIEKAFQKSKEQEEQEKIKEGNIRLGKIVPTGKDLFVYKPDLCVDDDEALDYDYNAREEDLEESDDLLVDGVKNISIK